MRVVVVGASREPSSQANEGSGSASDEVRATLPQPEPAEGQQRWSFSGTVSAPTSAARRFVRMAAPWRTSFAMSSLAMGLAGT